MNKLIIPFVTALMLGATLPALAGPDFQAIERARKAKQAAPVVQTTAGRRDCPPPPLVLTLDHGPRAQTTPQQNQMRRARYEAQMQACKDAAK